VNSCKFFNKVAPVERRIFLSGAGDLTELLPSGAGGAPRLLFYKVYL